MPMTSQGDASVAVPPALVAPDPHVRAKAEAVSETPFHVREAPPILLTPRLFVPPAVAGQDIPEAVQFRLAAVGTAPGWAALSFCSPTGFIKVFRGQEVRIRLPPARTTVVPLPVTSQARPRRGSTPVWSPDHRVSRPPEPCCTKPAFGSKLAQALFLIFMGETYS